MLLVFEVSISFFLYFPVQNFRNCCNTYATLGTLWCKFRIWEDASTFCLYSVCVWVFLDFGHAPNSQPNGKQANDKCIWKKSHSEITLKVALKIQCNFSLKELLVFSSCLNDLYRDVRASYVVSPGETARKLIMYTADCRSWQEFMQIYSYS